MRTLTFLCCLMAAACKGDDATPADAAPTADGGAPTEIPLAGCGVAYTAAVTLGGSQTFNMLLDSASTTVAIASSACSTCGPISPLYQPGASATDLAKMAMGSYASDPPTGWSGEIFDDTVLIAGAPSAVTVDLVSVATQSNFFDGERCGDNSYQGIFGLGRKAVEVAGTNSYLDQLAASGAPDVLSFQLCPSGGSLWLGAVRPNPPSPIQYTPMTTDAHFYTITLSEVQVANAPLGLMPTDYGAAFVDTGGTAFWLPTNAFVAVRTAIGQSAAFQSRFGDATKFFAQQNDTCTPTTETAAQLDAALPPLSLIFGADASVRVESPATQSYLLAEDDGAGGVCYVPSLLAMPVGRGGSLPPVELGAAVLKGKTIVIDRANKQVGFAPGDCPAGH